MGDSIRICYIGDGRSIHTQRWVKHFSGLGHDVHLITNMDVKLDNVTVHLIGGTGTLKYIGRVFKARKIIKKIKPDVVHAHFVTDSGFIGAISGFHPLVISPWGSDIVRQPEESKIYRLMVKYALKRADVVQCGDENMESRIRTLVGDRGNIRNIGWGVDTEVFKPCESKRTGSIRLLYLRISHDNYRTNTLLEAMPEVLRKHPDAKFVILKKGEHLDRTLKAVKDMNVEGNVEFIEPVPHSEMPAILNRCDIYVDTVYNPLPGCGIGITSAEAMSCGLPILIANTNGFEKYITHKFNGYVYQGIDSKALASSIDELISDAELRKRIGNNARNYAVKHQSWQKNMTVMETLYRKLISKGDEK